jgi:hypothetical protein
LFDVLGLAREMRSANFPACATSARTTSQPYFKDLLGFYTSDGINFVSGKQKSAIFGFF